jgi:hypothetical protein
MPGHRPPRCSHWVTLQNTDRLARGARPTASMARLRPGAIRAPSRSSRGSSRAGSKSTSERAAEKPRALSSASTATADRSLPPRPSPNSTTATRASAEQLWPEARERCIVQSTKSTRHEKRGSGALVQCMRFAMRGDRTLCSAHALSQSAGTARFVQSTRFAAKTSFGWMNSAVAHAIQVALARSAIAPRCALSGGAAVRTSTNSIPLERRLPRALLEFSS